MLRWVGQAPHLDDEYLEVFYIESVLTDGGRSSV